MIGAIAGDIIGSIYEGKPVKHKEFLLFDPRSTFTDDTVLTVAVVEVLLTGGDYQETFRRYHGAFPGRGYGAGFTQWIVSSEALPYNSFGNGSAMRVSPVGWACDTLDEVVHEAQRSAEVSHNHIEGIKGAQATAAAVFLARAGHTKQVIKDYIQSTYRYDLDRSLDAIRPYYMFDVSCQGSVPESIISFLESADYEDAIRNAISLGGDSDTMACIAGAIAEAYYGGVPRDIQAAVFERLDPKLAKTVESFALKYLAYKPMHHML
ncbi:MAG: ADP-ribosylglycohydrolase family protein [Gammaproteobacteria bacterium]|nr:ADP-ribosylglycohydrolase family protein [Gammaproteobacteria bacterium]